MNLIKAATAGFLGSLLMYVVAVIAVRVTELSPFAVPTTVHRTVGTSASSPWWCISSTGPSGP